MFELPDLARRIRDAAQFVTVPATVWLLTATASVASAASRPAHVPKRAPTATDTLAAATCRLPPAPPAESVFVISDSLRGVIRTAWANGVPGRPLRVAHLGDSHSEQGGFGAELATQLSRGTAVSPAFLTPYSRNLGLVRIQLSPGWTRSTWRSGPTTKIEGPSGSAAITTRARSTMRLTLPANLPAGSRLTIWWTGTAGTAFHVRAGSTERVITRRAMQADSTPLEQSEFPLPAGAAEVMLDQLRIPKGGTVRIGGFTVERPDAVVEYDLLALGATTHRHPVAREAGSLRQFLRHRQHDVVVLWYGTNSIRAKPFDNARFQQEYLELVQLVRRESPNAALIMIGPPDIAGPDTACREWITQQRAKIRGARRSSKRSSKRRPRRPTPTFTMPPIACPLDSGAVDSTHVDSTFGSATAVGTAIGTSGARVVIARGPTCVRETHPNTANVRDLEKAMAQQVGAAFFDPFRLQGEAGGIVRWQCQRPALASKDLVHLTDLGYRTLARTLASMLEAPGTPPPPP
jgi:lysophospholipase L1-like esterase